MYTGYGGLGPANSHQVSSNPSPATRCPSHNARTEMLSRVFTPSSCLLIYLHIPGKKMCAKTRTLSQNEYHRLLRIFSLYLSSRMRNGE